MWLGKENSKSLVAALDNWVTAMIPEGREERRAKSLLYVEASVTQTNAMALKSVAILFLLWDLSYRDLKHPGYESQLHYVQLCGFEQVP